MNGPTVEIAKTVLAASKAAQTEVIVTASKNALTRFANNTIHQNVAEEDTYVIVRAVAGKRVGIASGNDVSKSGLRRLAKTALEIARRQMEIPDFPGLPAPKPVADVSAYSAATAALSPAKRASAAVSIIRPSARKGAIASGAISNESSTLTAANSLGVLATAGRTEFEAMAVIEKDSGAGCAAGISTDYRSVDVRRIGKTALRKCINSQNPREIEPAEYAVVLEPQAVAGLLAYMAYMGFGAQNYLEGRSFLCGRLGAKIMHDSVSVWDDGLDASGMPVPFDYEGQPKTRVPLIESGVARSVVYDSYFAARAGTVSTGHAMPPGSTTGPLPTNLFMGPGASSLDEMIASTERGLLVTRFHYVNIADPSNAVLTGLTRDGTFLIEKGRVRYPVKNLRFTESMLAAFSEVEGVSRDRSLEPAMLGAALVPAVKMSSFRFTGVTQF